MNLNKVFIVGRLTADPILRTTPSGQSVTSFSVATNRNWADKSGNRQEEVEYHNIVAWGRQAEIANQFLTKGAIVMVEGRIRTRSWTDKQSQTRKTTEIICERLQLGPRTGGASAARPTAPQTDSAFNDLEGDSKPQKDAIEEIPVINLEDTEDIKPEDIPF